MSKKKSVHIVPRPTGWAVKKEGNSRASEVHRIKSEATKAGREMAKENKVELVIHNKDGKISDKDSYGKDPNPPKDKRH